MSEERRFKVTSEPTGADVVDAVEQAMRLMWEAPYRVEHWSHHPRCSQKLGGDHIRCPIDPLDNAERVVREEGA